MQEKVLSALSAIMLALTYFVAGFAVCAGVPGVTEQLAMRYSEADLSPFEHPELTQLAVATRDYTVGSHDLDALTGAIADANSKAATPYAGSSAEELLSEVPDAYTLDEEAIAAAAATALVVTVEEGVIAGGAGQGVLEVLARLGAQVPAITLGIPDQFVGQGPVGRLFADLGLDAEGIAAAVRAKLK